MPSFGPRGISPVQLSEPLYQAALKRAGVPSNSLPPQVLAMLKTRLEEGLQQELETEFDRRYLEAIDTADHKLSPQELAAIEQQVAGSLTEAPLSEAHLLDRTEELVHKIFSGSPRTLDTALKSESRLEKASPLPAELSALIGEYIFGEEWSYFDLQNAILGCEQCAGTGLETAWIRQIENFVLSRLSEFEKHREILTPEFRTFVNATVHDLRAGGPPDMERLRQIRGRLQQFAELQGSLLTTDHALGNADLLQLMVSAYELGYQPAEDTPFAIAERQREGSGPPELVLRLLRSSPEVDDRWWDGLQNLLQNLSQTVDPSMLSRKIREELLHRFDQLANKPKKLKSMVDRVIYMLIENNTPLPLIKPILQQWAKLHPDRVGVATFISNSPMTPPSPLEAAIRAWRPELVQTALELGIPLYSTSTLGRAVVTPGSWPTHTFSRVGHEIEAEEIDRMIDNAAEIPIDGLARTTILPLGYLLLGFGRDASVPAHAIFGLAAQSHGEPDLDQRLALLKEKLVNEEAQELLVTHVHPQFLEKTIDQLLEDAAQLVREGRGMENSRLRLLRH